MSSPLLSRSGPLAVLLALAIAAPASALPRDFWGAVPQGPLSDAQLSRLKRGGVDSIRIPFHWTQAHPRDPLEWSATDAQIAALARAGLEPLPFLYGAPCWAVRPR
ncbi:MAG: hypothetical protein WA862_08330, partial [Solirubrobacterales bacterium]